MTHEIEIVDILDLIDPFEFTGSLWRTTWQGRAPLVGGTGGGRWSPKSGFEVLYTSLEADSSISELHYHLSQAPVFSSSNVELFKIQCSGIQALDLTQEKTLSALRLDPKDKSKEQAYQCQKIGAAAFFLGLQAILVPGYRDKGVNCILFMERLDLNVLEIISSQSINWPAWIKGKNSKGTQKK